MERINLKTLSSLPMPPTDSQPSVADPLSLAHIRREYKNVVTVGERSTNSFPSLRILQVAPARRRRTDAEIDTFRALIPCRARGGFSIYAPPPQVFSLIAGKRRLAGPPFLAYLILHLFANFVKISTPCHFRLGHQVRSKDPAPKNIELATKNICRVIDMKLSGISQGDRIYITYMAWIFFIFLT